MNTRSKSVMAATLAIAALLVGTAAGRAAAPVVGHLYTLNNDGRANAVVVLDRRADGTLNESSAPAPTGGTGLVVPSGGDFDAQGAVRIAGTRLFAVNPGSNSIAVFDIAKTGQLKAVPGSPFASGGSTPLSITVHGDLVYVANQAVPFANPTNAPNITAFRLSNDGRLTPIAGSTIEFPAGQGPADVEFNPSGTVLAVTAAFQSSGELHTYAVQNGRSSEGGAGLAIQSQRGQRNGGFLLDRRRTPRDGLELPRQRRYGVRRRCGDRGRDARGHAVSEQSNRLMLDGLRP